MEKDSYLLDCARYIERNPLRAEIVKDLAHYKWSSYLFYACGNKNDIITKNHLYSALADSISTRQKAYREYILTSRAYEEIVDREFKIA